MTKQNIGPFIFSKNSILEKNDFAHLISEKNYKVDKYSLKFLGNKIKIYIFYTYTKNQFPLLLLKIDSDKFDFKIVLAGVLDNNTKNTPQEIC